MLFKLPIALIILFATSSVFSRAIFQNVKKCNLPEEETIVVGCSYDCNYWIRTGLTKAAKRLGYNIQIKNLYAADTTPDISNVDAVIIPGGADINPKYYNSFVGEELRKHYDGLDHLVGYTYEGDQRDPFEYQLLKQYFSSSKYSMTPVLGICRGMQMLGVSQKIPLYIDIKEELDIRNRRWTIDRIHVQNEESVIQSIVDKARFWGVEYHHQGLRLDYYNERRELWPNLEITAVSNEGKIAEVLEFYDRPILGTQFHPEWTFGKVRRGIFSWLLKRACHKKSAE